MQRTLDGLSGHVVVIGFVSLGQLVAGQLKRAGKQVVVIDRDKTKAAIAPTAGTWSSRVTPASMTTC